MHAIIFDFDGTLADTAPGIVKTMEQTFLRMGTPIPSEVDMRATIGIPLLTALQQLGHYDDADAQRATDIYREIFVDYELGSISIFDGVPETLAQLHARGYRMAIATSRNAESLDMILRRYHIDQYFETRVTFSDNLPHKPAPGMVLELLRRMQLTCDDAVVVGDTTYDIEMGLRAGCQTIAVTYGNHSVERLMTAHPTRLIDQFPELLNWAPKIVCNG